MSSDKGLSRPKMCHISNFLSIMKFKLYIYTNVYDIEGLQSIIYIAENFYYVYIWFQTNNWRLFIDYIYP